jgi:hypothetical protein
MIFKRPKATWLRGNSTVFVAPIPHLRFEENSITLFDGTLIRPATGRDQKIFNRREDWAPLLSNWYSQFTLVTGEWVAEVRERSANYERASEKARERFERLITACRLIGLSPYFGSGAAFQPRVRDSTRFFLPSGLVDRLPYGNDNDYLNRRNARLLRRIYKRLAGIAGEPRVALSRFNRVFSRESHEDRIIDIWIGLEALFSPSDGELSFRTALRLACYLEDDNDRRQKTFDWARESYKLRSKIVHGKTTIPRQPLSQVPVAVTEAESYLRRCLFKIPTSEESFDASKIEKSVIRGVSP